MRTEKPRHIVWLDIETEGLSPLTCSILEVAIEVAPFERPYETKRLGHWVLHRPLSSISGDPEAIVMHRQGTLLQECDRSRLHLLDVEGDILQRWPSFIPEGSAKPYLGGSSVHFDRRFLQVYMPAVLNKVCHRHVDVSSLELFCQMDGMPALPKAGVHRAVADIQETLMHARVCTEWRRAFERGELQG
jgi:oligoribonuclease